MFVEIYETTNTWLSKLRHTTSKWSVRALICTSMQCSVTIEDA